MHVASPTISRRRLTVTGLVQGVGFRPFVYRLAKSLELSGWVCNTGQAVVVEIQGRESGIERFHKQLRTAHPGTAQLFDVAVEPCAVEIEDAFVIRASRSDAPAIPMLPDLATCPDCIRELNDPADRRYRYPFTNCTQCGPRFSIIERLPYDRPHTTMERFDMCPRCRAEYDNPANRRFHAQPNACPDCGPSLAFLDGDGTAVARHDDALRHAVEAIRSGAIVAIKGVGGFHLVCDAASEDAVARLRKRKCREAKPLALMARDLPMARRYCRIDAAEAALLMSPAAPIVLLQRRTGSRPLATSIAPDCPEFGVMLPSNPLHHLVMQELNTPVIATSGNRSEEPLCASTGEALGRLSDIADHFLTHDRLIACVVDDSVARIVAGRTMLLRRARGYAPAFFPGQAIDKPVLATGGHLKNTVALGFDGQVLLSPYIGDLDTDETLRRFTDTIQHLERIYALAPSKIACDMHPDYASTQWAGHRPEQKIPVQHHVAHVYATIGEHGIKPPVLGAAWDGIGYGNDGTAWGGEWFEVDAAGCRRVAHLASFGLPGMQQAVREPRRAALGVLYETYGSDAFSKTALLNAMFESHELALLKQMLENNVQVARTTSMGRLFDAVAALAGLCQRNRFEGEAAMRLEWAAAGLDQAAPYPFELAPDDHTGALSVDWRPAIRALIDEVGGRPAAEISARFHATVVDMLFAVVRRLDASRVALGGGCFQNATMLKHIVARADQAQVEIYWPCAIPPNDGGLAFGQLVAVQHEPTPGGC